MITRQDDEETPLMHRPEQVVASTPLPWDQFWIILFLQFSDSLVFQTLAPFTPQLIRDIVVTHRDESQVGHYAVILVSMFSFGLLKTFVGLVISRAFCGAFNGSNGIIKSMVMDVTDATNLPKAYGYMPLPWMLETLIGPLVGGSLSRPADRFPEIFGNPYLLPCIVPAIFASVAWLVTYFRFKEGVESSVTDFRGHPDISLFRKSNNKHFIRQKQSGIKGIHGYGTDSDDESTCSASKVLKCTTDDTHPPATEPPQAPILPAPAPNVDTTTPETTSKWASVEEIDEDDEGWDTLILEEEESDVDLVDNDKPSLSPSRAAALAWLWPTARPEVLQSPSPQKPSPSRGFQAEPGLHITSQDIDITNHLTKPHPIILKIEKDNGLF
ncbi:hypothetical protein BDR06DRAFT_975638 [Suillus hirtellus]|nr:hypothetical protein BDR06DRAFT_975638 [Suillus hirtellus]